MKFWFAQRKVEIYFEGSGCGIINCFIVDIVSTCLVLHKFCTTFGDNFTDEWQPKVITKLMAQYKNHGLHYKYK